jgi:hypothetical protein
MDPLNLNATLLLSLVIDNNISKISIIKSRKTPPGGLFCPLALLNPSVLVKFNTINVNLTSRFEIN